VLIILGIVLLIFLPGPWNLFAFGTCLVLWTGELFLWNRTVKHRREAVGAQNLIGVDGEVITACRPDGQIRLNGEIWQAHCVGGADVGDRVRVVGRDRLKLVVERNG
jgi:membrane protein implicated in regulation of membrane protease activity